MTAADFAVDAVVVGAGAVGLACARAIALRGHAVVVLERETAIGQGVSSRSSEVLHAGIYYPPGSLRARLCVDGNRLMRDYLASRGIGYDPCGKFVVATDADELARLEELAGRGHANGVPELALLSRGETLAREPALHAAGALRCGTSGVFDSHGYMLALRGEIESLGGAIATGTPFVRAERTGDGFRVHAGGADPAVLRTPMLVLAAGLSAQATARAVDGFPVDAIPVAHMAKGNYFAFAGRAPFARLVYPLPVPGALGTHYRRDLGGQGVFGPDIEWIDREDYAVDTAPSAPFVEAIRRYWPQVEAERLTPSYCGIRPKIHGPGESQPDFRIDLPADHGIAGLAALFGIESPGLTASLAIGEHVARRLFETCN